MTCSPGGESVAPPPVLWTQQELLDATGGAARGLWPAGGVGGLQIDSREVGPGDLFIALTGGARDGHGFVGAALAAGAGAALVSRAPGADLPADAPLLRVSGDTLHALARLAAAARARLSERAAVIGVTGSAGKTTVKEMLRAMGRAALAASGPAGAASVHAAARSFNNHIGAPLTLARLPADARLAAIEIGMNHPGEIAPLARLARPHAAIITTVAPAHLEAFDDVGGIADEKASILDGVTPGGAAILNADNPYFERISAHARALGLQIVDFGRAARSARLLSIDARDGDGAPGQRVSAEIFGWRTQIEIGAPGAHLAQNAVAALAALETLSTRLDRVDRVAAAQALRDWRPGAGRGARHRLAAPGGGGFVLVDESYNANPASLRAALASFAAEPPGPGGRRVAFLTDMLELGPSAEALHAEIAADLERAGVETVYAAGPLMGALFGALAPERRGAWYAAADEMARAAPALVRDGDVVVVKGSLGSRAKAVAERFLALGPAPDPGRGGADANPVA